MTKREQIISGCALLALLIIGTFCDLSVSKAVYRPASAFGKVFEVIGEFPCYALAAFAFAILGSANDGHFKSNFFRLSCLFFAITAFAVAFHPLGWHQTYAVLPGAALASLLFPAVRVLKRSFDPSALKRVSVVIVVTVLIEAILVQGLKLLWGRPRFYAVLEDPSLYLPWYMISGLASSDAFKSFPSAHASDAAVIMCLTLFEPVVSLLGKRRAILHMLVYAFMLCVMLSRIVIGAHFLSDVAFGAGITFCAFYAARRIEKQWPNILIANRR